MKRRSLLMPEKAAPSKEEIAARPELVKQMLATASQNVDAHDLEFAIVVGITSTGGHKIYHSYGKDLPMEEVARLLTDLAAMARKAGRKQ